jgi:hypothetical protein
MLPAPIEMADRTRKKIISAQCLISIAYWRRGTSVRQYIGVPMPPAPLLLADRWFHTQSRQSAELSSCRRNWDSPNPSPAGENAHPFENGGRGTIAGERGGGRVPIPTRGHTLWYSINICMYFVVLKRGGPNSSVRLAYFQANRLLTELYKQETEIS